MRTSLLCLAFAVSALPLTVRANLLVNGSLDSTAPREIVPTFFLPFPTDWTADGSRTLTGPYNDFLSSEPWAGPAPTPVTANDQGVFFKPFSGGSTHGPATGNLYQDLPASPGVAYRMTGWAGAEVNAIAPGTEYRLEFLNSGGGVIGGTTLNLFAAGLITPNGQAFNYKQYTLDAIAPVGTTAVRTRVSMIGGIGNPLGGGQAIVVDDFSLVVVPEPTAALAFLGTAMGLVRRRRAE